MTTEQEKTTYTLMTWLKGIIIVNRPHAGLAPPGGPTLGRVAAVREICQANYAQSDIFGGTWRRKFFKWFVVNLIFWRPLGNLCEAIDAQFHILGGLEEKFVTQIVPSLIFLKASRRHLSSDFCRLWYFGNLLKTYLKRFMPNIFLGTSRRNCSSDLCPLWYFGGLLGTFVNLFIPSIFLGASWRKRLSDLYRLWYFGSLLKTFVKQFMPSLIFLSPACDSGADR